MKISLVRKYLGYTGVLFVVVAGLWLFFSVAQDLFEYTIKVSEGNSDDRWVEPDHVLNDEELWQLFIWGWYLLVVGIHLFLYFRQMVGTKEFNVWALPSLNVPAYRILSFILSLIFLVHVIWFHTLTPGVFIPIGSSGEFTELAYSIGKDEFWTVLYYPQWQAFTWITSLHLLIFLISSKKKKFSK